MGEFISGPAGYLWYCTWFNSASPLLLALRVKTGGHLRAWCGLASRPEFVRHVDHGNPLNVLMGIDPFDEAFLRAE